MSTHVQGFQSFFEVFLHRFVLAKLATSSIRVNIYFQPLDYNDGPVHVMLILFLFNPFNAETTFF